jgi:hypothetical protein
MEFCNKQQFLACRTAGYSSQALQNALMFDCIEWINGSKRQELTA